MITLFFCGLLRRSLGRFRGGFGRSFGCGLRGGFGRSLGRGLRRNNCFLRRSGLDGRFRSGFGLGNGLHGRLRSRFRGRLRRGRLDCGLCLGCGFGLNCGLRRSSGFLRRSGLNGRLRYRFVKKA